jgi:hypothetical protein
VFFRVFLQSSATAAAGTSIAECLSRNLCFKELRTVRIRSALFITFAWLALFSSPVDAAQVKIAWDANSEPDVTGYVVEWGAMPSPFTQAVDVGNVTTWTLSTATPGIVYGFRVIAYDADGLRSDASVPVFANTDGPVTATLTVDRSSLTFGVVSGNGVRTGAQQLRLTQTGSGPVTWSASTSASWLQISPTSGSGSGIISVALGPNVPSTTSAATITITANGVMNSIAPVTVLLGVVSYGASAAPVGVVDTPADNITGVTGSLAITGWAIDDIDVTRVRILRDSVAGEPGGLVYVGDATMVEDARPDVAVMFPTAPQNARAGWGYLLLTNMLPSLGNGTFRFSVYADDPEGHATLLGRRTITCTNSTATQPFGAIDTPAPGQTISGTLFHSFGWVLSRGKRADGAGGGTVNVVIDGVVVGSPAGWVGRSDLSALFPANLYPGINNAVGVYSFDTTALSNGVHTIAWGVTDNAGAASGVGSRYFRVFNSAQPSLTLAPAAMALQGLTLESELDGAARDQASIEARRGYSTDTPMRRYRAGADGRVTVQAEELDRLELQTNGATAGYLIAGSSLRPLPIGSRLDPATGTFVWQPGVGFVGAYDLAFVRHTGDRVLRQDVRIVLNPKGSNRVGPQLFVDLKPGPNEDATEAIVAGWAADLDSADGTGIQMIHVWAYPRNGGAPIFVADAAYGGTRPDVAAVFGDNFRDSGFGLRVQGLPPGEYNLALFPWSTARHAWLPATVVPITVR